MDVGYLKHSLFETQTEKAIFPMSLFLKLKKKLVLLLDSVNLSVLFFYLGVF